MKKQVVALLLTGTLILPTLLFGGCGEGTDVDFGNLVEEVQSNYDESLYVYDGEPCEISWAHWDSVGPMEEATSRLIIEAFEKRYPTIKVNLDIISDYQNLYANNIAAGQVHDVFLVPDGAFRQWSTNGSIFTNLKPFLNQSLLISEDVIANDMFEGAIERYTSENDAVLALPKDIGPYVMYYNKDMFDAMGVEYPPNDRIMSIEEASEMWRKLTDASQRIYGIAAYPWEGLVWSAGGDFLNEDHTAFPTDPAQIAGLKKAFTFLQDAMYGEDPFMPTGSDLGGQSDTTLFAAQRCATVIAGRWEVTSMRTYDFNWDVAYVPAFEGENMQKNCWSGSIGYAVYSGAENKVAAWKLVEYIASREGQELLAASGFAIPIYNSLATDERIVERELSLGPQNYQVFIESAKHQPAGTHTWLSSNRWRTESYDALSAQLFALNPSSRISVDEFLEDVKERVNSIL